MVCPLKVFDLLLEITVVVQSVADIQDQIVALMLGVQVLNYIFYIVSINLLEDCTGWECHSYYPFRYVGQVKMVALVFHHLLRARDHLLHKIKHFIM